jgi:NADPH:quinone reductase-like Zn-dependent oxidoreductase
MKAYIIEEPGKGPDSWKQATLPEPKLGYGEVRVRVIAVSVNRRDVMVVRNQYGPGIKQNLIPLSDGAGEVLVVGEGVTKLKKGDRVAGTFFQDWATGPIHPDVPKSALGFFVDGMLAEEVVLKERGVVRIPDHLSFEEAATLPCAGVTAWNALMESAGPLKPGSIVLTLGTGGVSTFAIKFAKAAGCTVIGTSSSDEKLERLRELGIDYGINYKKSPDWSAEVLKLTNGYGADRVVEVGGSGTIHHSMQSVRIGGTVCIIGGLSGSEERIGPRQVLQKMLHMQGIYVGSGAMFEAMNRAITANKIRPEIDQVFSFDQASDALRKMESSGHLGKLVIRVG